MIKKIQDLIFTGNARSVTIKKNIIASLGIRGCSIIISLMLVPMTLGYVSSELYGIWLTLSSIMLWLNFFDVGFTLGLKNKLAEAIAQNNLEKGKSLVSTTYFMMILIFIPLLIILESTIPFINWSTFLNVQSIYNEEIIKCLYILAACFCIQMILNVFTAVVAAFQQVALSSLFPVIGNFFSLITIFFLTKYCPPSLLALAIAISVMPLLVIFTASIIFFKRKYKNVSPNIHYIDRKYAKELFTLGYKFFLIQIQGVVLYQCTNILISRLSGPEYVTAYNIAYKYLNIALMVYSIVLTPLWPAFTDAYTRKDFIWMKSIYKKMTRFYIFSACIVILMIASSNIIYKLWIGDRAEVPFSMTLALGIFILINSWDALQVNLINGIGTIKLQTYVTLIGLIFHIPLSLFIGKYIGAIGVVISMTIIICIYSIFFTIQIKQILTQKAKGIWIK
ncbi:oligosaccharide flippase family protein [uncultured Phocaeicola sp.]|uniref:oligosaccharide flippase family protein n=1 Tax=uncultured Phocaeicola sp. TaxID=990718 RepID=UPI0025E0654A|nr:oligosaccharide flippase family protein [uncultured Phocaeicola sp.]